LRGEQSRIRREGRLSGVANRKNSWEIERRERDLIGFDLSFRVWIWSKGRDRVERDMIYMGK
jgi:hypothetical protein